MPNTPLKIIAILFIFSMSCKNNSALKTNTEKAIMDQPTENLFNNLKKIADQGKVMFGAANPTTLM